eukprot:4050123-Alexandrium_andersonii.AAC.1
MPPGALPFAFPPRVAQGLLRARELYSLNAERSTKEELLLECRFMGWPTSGTAATLQRRVFAKRYGALVRWEAQQQ